MPLAEVRLRGEHNLSNALAALALVLPLDPPPPRCAACWASIAASSTGSNRWR